MYLSRHIFVLPLFLKDTFAGYRIIGWQVFLPQHFAYLFLFFGGHDFQKPALIVSWNPFYDVLFCSCHTFKILSSSLTFRSFTAWGPLKFLYSKVNIFHQICQDFSQFFLEFFSDPFFPHLLRVHLNISCNTNLIHKSKDLFILLQNFSFGLVN